jgi:hypothetical protein
MPKPTVDLILEMEKILTSNFNFFNFPSNFPLKKNCSKLPNIQVPDPSHNPTENPSMSDLKKIPHKRLAH